MKLNEPERPKFKKKGNSWQQAKQAKLSFYLARSQIWESLTAEQWACLAASEASKAIILPCLE